MKEVVRVIRRSLLSIEENVPWELVEDTWKSRRCVVIMCDCVCVCVLVCGKCHAFMLPLPKPLLSFVNAGLHGGKRSST